MDLGRLLVAMATPFDQELKVDLPRARELAVRLVDRGVEGLVVCGTTGESPTLTRREKLDLFRAVVGAVGDRARVIAGTGTNDTVATVELTRDAAQTGVHGVMVVGPYYSRPSQTGLYNHFAAAAAATDLPLIIYNVPTRTARNVDPDTVLRLAQLPNVVALKEASSDLEQTALVCRGAPAGFMVYSGADELTLPQLAVGAHGAISVIGHLVPETMGEMIRAFFAGDVQRAARLHWEVLPVAKACFLPSGSPSCLKRFMELGGFSLGGVRLPLAPADDKDTAAIRAVAEAHGLLASA